MIENLRDKYMDLFVKSGKIEHYIMAKQLSKLAEDVYNANKLSLDSNIENVEGLDL